MNFLVDAGEHTLNPGRRSITMVVHTGRAQSAQGSHLPLCCRDPMVRCALIELRRKWMRLNIPLRRQLSCALSRGSSSTVASGGLGRRALRLWLSWFDPGRL